MRQLDYEKFEDRLVRCGTVLKSRLTFFVGRVGPSAQRRDLAPSVVYFSHVMRLSYISTDPPNCVVARSFSLTLTLLLTFALYAVQLCHIFRHHPTL